jgi:hypothetical protein
MDNPIEQAFIKKCFEVDHLQKQRQNTFNHEERAKFDEQIKLVHREIDILLDEHNMRKHFQNNLIK